MVAPAARKLRVLALRVLALRGGAARLTLCLLHMSTGPDPRNWGAFQSSCSTARPRFQHLTGRSDRPRASVGRVPGRRRGGVRVEEAVQLPSLKLAPSETDMTWCTSAPRLASQVLQDLDLEAQVAVLAAQVALWSKQAVDFNDISHIFFQSSMKQARLARCKIHLDSFWLLPTVLQAGLFAKFSRHSTVSASSSESTAPKCLRSYT